MSLLAFRERIERQLPIAVEEMGEKSGLRDSCLYALMAGGKRLRPIITLITAEALGHDLDVLDAALSVEFFHTASLIADDLPCMDNDDFRRNRPSLHKAFGESVALLASYTLIAAGYGGIHQNGQKMQSHPRFTSGASQAVCLSLEAATRCAGIRGATQGQFFDLFPPDSTWETLGKIMYLKTVTLFEISFFFGWLFGGGHPDALGKLKECAYHLGMAFQIADDLDDKDRAVKAFGEKKAEEFFTGSLEKMKKALQDVGLWTASFQELHNGLRDRCGLFAGVGQLFVPSC